MYYSREFFLGFYLQMGEDMDVVATEGMAMEGMEVA